MWRSAVSTEVTNEVEAQVDQINACQGENQVPANDDACIENMVDQIDQRHLGVFVVAEENNLRSLFRHEVLA